jgi:two-component system, cell cycle sensor histidine kinase and response regulator CckA
MIAYDQAELAHALFEESGDALFLLDPDTDKLLEVSPVAQKMTGYGRSELVGSSAAALFRFESAGGMHRLKGAFTKSVVFHGQDGFLLRTKGEAWVPVSLTVSRLHVAPKPLGLITARDDRERRSALAQARRVEAELRTVLTNAPAALWSAERAPGPDVFSGWQFRYVSPLMAKLAGRAADQLDHPFRWAELVHPTDRDAYRAALRKLVVEGTELEQSYRIQAVEGTRWVTERLQVVRDASARPVRLDGCLVDMTDRRRTEDALRQSEERFRALVEKSRDGILLVDERGAVRYASPAARTVLGFPPDELVGTEAFALVHPDDLAVARRRFARALQRPGEDVLATYRFRTAGGAVRLIELNAVNRLADPSVKAVVVNFRDVTEREASARALAKQNELLAGLFASVPDVLVYKDREGLFLGGNAAFEELAGRPISELVGKHCKDLFSDEWAQRLRVAEERVIATGETLRGRERIAYPDGREVQLDVAIAPLVGDDGATDGLILVGRDVTAQERMQEELRQAHKMEAVGRLAGGIAHDFNNLLTVVLGNLELIRTGAAKGADANELLVATERAARQAADLTKQMLGFARRQPLRAAVVDLNALAREAIGLLRRTIDPRITVVFEPAEPLYPVAADPVQVQQVLMNLCLNARDAMPDGGALTVRTENVGPSEVSGERRDFVKLSVSDTGQGMSADVKAKIFDPFFTTKEVGKGTGLGLAVVYGVATAHGGCVDVWSQPGLGSRFDVYLPRAPATDELTGGAPRATEPLPQGRGETVLVADDEPGVRDLARAGLEMVGFRVLVAADGVEAVDVFRGARDSIKAIVLDVGMPRMSGRQAFDAIRALDPGARVLFASGYTDAAPLPEMNATTRALQKPYIPSQLAAAVADLIAARA